MTMSTFANTIFQKRYAHEVADRGGIRRENWAETADRVVEAVLGAVNAPRSVKASMKRAIGERKFLPGGRYLAASGRPYHQVQNCVLLRADDTREGWADLLSKVTLCGMTGAGVGVDYSELREKGAILRRTGGVSSGPLALMQMVNEAGRGAAQGGDRRAALWAGLSWAHPDVLDFIRMKDWLPEVRALKEKDFSFPAPMDHTNISVILDDDFFAAYHDGSAPKHSWAHQVYWAAVQRMVRTGEPGFSVNIGEKRRETLRNACTEITSEDDSDICNLGSINLARIESPTEMAEIVELGTLFLLAGTVYSDVPYPRIAQVRARNRRLGLGLLGVHEFLLARGLRYEASAQLADYLEVYERSADFAKDWSMVWSLSNPVATRAIAPTGTIGIVAETTTGIEPVLCAAYKRRYRDGRAGNWSAQYVLDPTVKKLAEKGLDPTKVEDAYTIDSARRVDFQAWMQTFVDHSISSTINMPPWGSPANNPDTVREFGEMLIRRLPETRGLTVYPDGARGGQPLTKVPWEEAVRTEGEIFVESVDVCDLTRGGSCGA